MNQFKQIFFNIRVKNELHLLIVLASNRQLDRGVEINPLFKTNKNDKLSQLDVYLEDAIKLAQKFDLMGENSSQRTLVELYIDHFKIVFDKIVELYFETSQTKKKQIRQKILNETFPNNLKFVEAKLERSSNGYLVGDTITFADIFLVFLLDWFKDDELFSILNDYRYVKGHYSMIKTIPRIAKSLNSVRPNTDKLRLLKNKKDGSYAKSVSTIIKKKPTNN